MIGARLFLALALCAGIAAAAPATSVPTTTLAAVRAGGVNAQPSMRPWRYSGANPDGWFCTRSECDGVRDGTVFVNRELPLIARLGATTVRVEFPWPLLEPERGRFTWARADFIVNRARRLRLAVQPVLVYSPSWAAPGRSDPPQAGDFARFARAFARRYRRTVRYIELWNEPDLARYWTGTQLEYVRRILVPGYRAIKQANPRARVIIGAPSRADARWLNAIYELGGGRAFDVMAFHDYSAGPQIFDAVRVVHSVLRAHGQPTKPIWLGEYGFDTKDTQAQANLVSLVLTTPGRLAVAQWYTLRDDYILTCCPPVRIGESSFGLMTSGYVRKPAYDTMRRLLASRRR